MFLPLSACCSSTASRRQALSHRSLFPRAAVATVSRARRRRETLRLGSTHSASCSLLTAVRSRPQGFTHRERLGGGDMVETEERNSEWAKDRLQKCLNAYSELPTAHVKPALVQTPSFSSFCLTSPFPLVSRRTQHLGSRGQTTTSGRR